MVISSHNMEDIDILCDSVYEMDRGKISTIRTEGVLSTPGKNDENFGKKDPNAGKLSGTMPTPGYN